MNNKAYQTLLLGITHVSGVEGFFFSSDIEQKFLYKHFRLQILMV